MADKTKEELQKPIQNTIKETILDNAPVIIAFHDKDHNIIWANEACQKATGLSLQELEGKKCYIAWGLKRLCNNCPVTKAIETGEPHEAELTPQNQEHWPDTQGSRLAKAAPIRDGEGNVIGAVETVFDITERKKAEKNLQDIIDKNPMSIQIVDKEGFTLSVNSAHTKLFGSVPSPDYSFFNDPQLKQLGFGELMERIKNGEVVNFPDTPYNAHDSISDLPDVPVWVHVVAFPINDSNGKPERFIFMHEDITERKRAEDTLRKSEARYRLLAENITDTIWVVDMDMKLVFISPSVTRLLGYSVEEAMNTTMKKVYTPASFELAMKALEDELINDKDRDSGRSRIMELELVRKDGSTIVVEGNFAFLRNENRQPSGILTIVCDITERKQAENALRETTGYLQNLITYANAPIIVWDPQFRISQFNHAFELLTGRKAGAVIGKPLDLLFPPALTENTMKLIQKTLTGERWEDIEISIQHIDGFVRTVLWNSATIFAPDGKTVVAIIAQGQDITERKHAQDEIVKTRDYVDNIIKSMFDTLIVINPDGKIRSINKATAVLLGYKEEELIGKPFGTIVAEEEEEEGIPFIGTRLKKLIKEGFIKEYDMTYKTKLGEMIPVSFSGAVMRDKDGELIGIVCIGRDLRERKKAEDALRESEVKYKALFANAAEGIVAADLETMQFRYANPAMCRMFGYTEEELVRLGVADIHPKESLDHVLAEFETQARGEKTLASELPCLRKDGTLFYANVSAAPIVLGGRKCNVGFFTDITEHKKAEEALKESQERYTKLIENLPVGVYRNTPGPQGRFIEANEAIVRMFEADSREEFLKHNVSDLYWDPSQREQFSKKLLRQGFVKGEVLELKTLKGNKMWCSLNTVAKKDKNGDFYFDGIVEDITERKNMEEALKKSEEELRQDKLTLEQKNLALKEMIEHIERTKNKTKEDMAINVDETLIPIVEKLKRNGASPKYIKLLQYHLKELSSSFGRKITQKSVKLTPREIEICNALRGGLSSKDLAELLNVSQQTIEKHRKNIRKKLNLSNKKANLITYLQNI